MNFNQSIAENKPTSEYPFVSVIMPVKNEAAFIARSLGALLAQNYPHQNLEIIIADGMSVDATRKIISELKEQTTIDIFIVDNEKGFAASGLNCALQNAKGEIIVRVDGHCEVEPDYVSNCVKYLQANEAEGVGGPIETIGETLLAKSIAVAMSSKFGVGGSAFRTINDRKLYVDTVAFPGYKREIIAKVGYFNEELVRNQDDEYNFRIRKSGGRILLSPDIRSRYYSRSTFRSLWSQYYQYGYWKVRVLQMHPRQMSIRQFIPFLFVTAVIVSALISFTEFGRWLLVSILGAYLLANLVASTLTAFKTNIKILPLLMINFSILHFSYGLGFLVGLIKFIKLWNKKVSLNPL